MRYGDDMERLKIDGIEVTSEMIAKGTFSAVENKRVVEIWTDANMIEHEVIADQPKVEIRFELREHSNEDHASFARLFTKHNNINVRYWSDRLNTYRDAVCRMEPIVFTHRSSYGGGIQYDTTPIALIEN